MAGPGHPGPPGDVCGLRFGELAGLTRGAVDLELAVVVVRADLDELDGGRLQPGEVKSAASRRTVSIPEALLDEARHHLDTYAEAGTDGSVFVGPAGGRLRRSNFRKQVRLPATQAVGLDGLRFHNLRHTGNAIAASLSELITSQPRPNRSRPGGWRSGLGTQGMPGAAAQDGLTSPRAPGP